MEIQMEHHFIVLLMIILIVLEIPLIVILEIPLIVILEVPLMMIFIIINQEIHMITINKMML